MEESFDQELIDDKLACTQRRRGYRIDVTQEARSVWCCMVATFEKCQCYRAKTRTAAFHKARNAILAGKFDLPLFAQQEQPPCKTTTN